MRMNPGIAMQGQPVNVLGAMDAGMQMGHRQNEMQRQNALAQAMQEHGPGLVQGDQRAASELAQFDPQMVAGVQNTQNQMEDRQARLAMAREQAGQQMAQRAQQMSQAELEAERQNMERGLAMGTKASNEEEWDAAMRSVGADDMIGQFENREMLIAGAMGIMDALDMGQGPEPRSPEGRLRADEMDGFVPEGTFESSQRGDGDLRDRRVRDLAGDLMRNNLAANEQEAMEIARGVMDNRYELDRWSGEVIDRATNQPIARRGEGRPDVSGDAEPPMPSESQPTEAPRRDENALTFGDRFGDASESFGPGGFGRRVANIASEALGAQPMFGGALESQADFGVLQEQLINDIASAYPRQPPSWLLENIRELTPTAGSVFTGPERAQSQLRAIGRNLEGERASAASRLDGGRLSRDARQEIEERISGLDAAIARVGQAVGAFDGDARSGERDRGGEGDDIEDILRLYE